MLSIISLYVATISAICFICLVLRRRNSSANQVILPPGSKGFPIIGETLQLLLPSYSLDLPSFITTRIQRYGPIFQTRLIGRPVVMSADPDFNRYIVQQEGRMAEMWYLDTFSKLFAQEGEARTNATGMVHKYLRNLTLSHFGSQSLRESLLPHLENLVRSTLLGWSSKDSIDVKHAALNMTIEFVAKLLFGYDCNKSKERLGEKFSHISQGLLSFPLNIPGTTYYSCLKSQREVMNMMRTTLKERRRASPETFRGDFLDHALKDLNTEKFLSEDFILQIMFGLLFASSESSSTTLALVLKFLSENPHALQELEAEHERILKSRESPDTPLTWDEVKSMTFTLQVINESLRLGNVSLGLLRRTLKDIQINGYTIPAGWTIMLVTSACQYNSDVYKDPLTFNPWRWKEMQPDVIAKNFMPFGGGTRQCAGAEFAKVLMTIFLHVLVTKYRWEKIKGGEIVRNPILGFRNALHVKLDQKD
ncbi:beta-amyrin 16-alpha-hydroxylase CYP87D16 [Beta vulgaris subsp. vulgaris]|uniref:beta-amyrin 16-alpha-hydroxylase CYP87D16 n=1 Tax=Beta vulgaris subsp. vulgaris TaxID=3555 RepID=UPI0020371DE5|nr:beta-amyrin 16-alpha-hydroxylase CYP87D16 [Beta vulgaris subsp. vulgaris]